jgi:hypothetical protein
VNLSSLRSDTSCSVAPTTTVHNATVPTATAPTASDRVLASELGARAEAHDALSMMVSSMARMVQAGRTRDSRWKDN